MSRMFGLTTDSIVEMTVVDAEGNLLTVNRISHPDLFWALKGAGSGSFAIVTQFTLKAYDPPKLIVFGEARYPKSMFPEVMAAWQRYILSTPPREVNSKMGLKDQELVVEIFEIETQEGQAEAGSRRVRAYLESFPLTDRLTVMPYNYPNFMMKTMHSSVYGITHPSHFASLTRHSNTPKRFKAKSFFASQELSESAIADWNRELHQIPVEKDIIIEFYQFGGAINDGENIQLSSFPHRNQAMYLVQAFYEWRPTVSMMDIEDSLDWLRSFFQVATSSPGTGGSYQNYADSEMPDYLQRYYGNNLERLMQVKRHVDPSNFFKNPQSIH